MGACERERKRERWRECESDKRGTIECMFRYAPMCLGEVKRRDRRGLSRSCLFIAVLIFSQVWRSFAVLFFFLFFPPSRPSLPVFFLSRRLFYYHRILLFPSLVQRKSNPLWLCCFSLSRTHTHTHTHTHTGVGSSIGGRVLERPADTHTHTHTHIHIHRLMWTWVVTSGGVDFATSALLNDPVKMIVIGL